MLAFSCTLDCIQRASCVTEKRAEDVHVYAKYTIEWLEGWSGDCVLGSEQCARGVEQKWEVKIVGCACGGAGCGPGIEAGVPVKDRRENAAGAGDEEVKGEPVSEEEGRR